MIKTEHTPPGTVSVAERTEQPKTGSDRSDASEPTDMPKRVRPMNENRRRCTATARRTGERCRKSPIIGGTVCRSHGGAAPQVRRAAMARAATADAMALVHSKGYTKMTDPVEALFDVASQMLALRSVLADRVAELTDQDLTHVDRAGQESISALLSALSQSLKDVGQLLVQINRLGLDRRRVDIETAKLQLIAGAIETAVYGDEADLDYEGAQKVLSAISAELGRLPISA